MKRTEHTIYEVSELLTTTSRTLLEILERLERLERLTAAADVEPVDEQQTLHSIALKMVDSLEQFNVLPEIIDTLRRAIREPMKPPASDAALATDNGLLRCYARALGGAIEQGAEHHTAKEAARRAVYDLGRKDAMASSCPHIRSSDEGASYCELAEQQSAPASAAPLNYLDLLDEVAWEICQDHRLVANWRPEARCAAQVIVKRMRESSSLDVRLAADWLEQEAAR